MEKKNLDTWGVLCIDCMLNYTLHCGSGNKNIATYNNNSLTGLVPSLCLSEPVYEVTSSLGPMSGYIGFVILHA